MGLGLRFLTWVGSGQIFVAQVGSDHPFLGWILKIFPKVPNFSIICPSGQKISSGWVKKYLDQSWVGLLFTAGQNYARFGSGQGRL